MNVKIALMGIGISSGGLVSVLRDLLDYETDADINLLLFCSPGFTKKLPAISKKIEVVETEYAVESKVKAIFGNAYSLELIRLVDSYAPDAVFYIMGSYKKGLERYESYFVLNNQLYTDFPLLFKQQNLKLVGYMSILALKIRSASRKIDHFFFSSAFSQKEAEEKLKISDAKVVPFACNSIFFRDAMVKNAAIQRDDFNMLCIGSIIPYKNQLSVIQAAHMLHDKGYGVKLKLVGGVISKRYYKKCCRYIQQNGMSDYVEHVCSVPFDEIPAAIDNCDIYVNSSETDTCGTAAEEGMARGAVVIANDVGFNREMVGDAGLYFSVRKPETLVEAVETVINDVSLQMALRDKAHVDSRKRTLKNTAGEYYEYIVQNYRQSKLR